MEAQLKTAGGRLLIKLDAPNTKELFKAIASVDEVFNSESACGICNSTDIRFVVRTVEENDYFELRCKCGARFQFGQSKKGGNLFPKRKDESGYLPHGGWAKYSSSANGETA